MYTHKILSFVTGELAKESNLATVAQGSSSELTRRSMVSESMMIEMDEAAERNRIARLARNEEPRHSPNRIKDQIKHHFKVTEEEEELRDFIDSAEKREIETAVQDALDWLERNPTAGEEELEAKLKEVDSIAIPIHKKTLEKASKYYFEKHQEKMRTAREMAQDDEEDIFNYD